MLGAWSRYAEMSGTLAGLAGLVSSVVLAGALFSPGTPETETETETPEVRAAVRVEIETEAQRRAVRASMVDLWSDSDTGTSVDVVMGPEGIDALRERGIAFEVLVPDIDAVAAAEMARIEAAEIARPGNWFAEYRDYETVDAYLDVLAARRPDLARVERLGASTHGRPIRALRLSAARDDAKAIVLNGGQHAREWISVMVSTCVADRMVSGYDTDPRIQALLDERVVWVAPVINPDGYVHSWESDRYWRKNRAEPYGVDLNRNWSVGFGARGSSSNRRSQIYRGPYAFSEPETRALRDLITREPVVAHVDFHSFGQMILYPWGYTKKPAPERDRLAALGDAMASAIAATHGEHYKLMSAAELYAAGGTALDWSYGEGGADGFTIELRPTGGSGFVLPPEQIVPTCDEGLAAVLALAERVD
ncbi:MAG: M14 family metallopeptidase [Nannocystales bacterium]